jgi:hypothetical protein
MFKSYVEEIAYVFTLPTFYYNAYVDDTDANTCVSCMEGVISFLF